MRRIPTTLLAFLPALLASVALAATALAAPPVTRTTPRPPVPAPTGVGELTLPPAALGTVTIFLVRHAEKSKDDPRDPSLTAAGQERARRLAELLAHEKITHLFSTPLKRTRGTLAPLATARALDVTTIMDMEEQAATLLALPAGATAVLAGHSNTVPFLVEALGGKVSDTVAGSAGPQLLDDSYDRLFVVILAAPSGSSRQRLLRLLQLRYGAP